MSRLNRRKQQAARRSVYAFRGYCNEARQQVKTWDVYVNAEAILGPRGLELTKRQAIHLAYRIAVAKKCKLQIEVTS